MTNPQELKQLIIEANQEGELTESLARVALRIATERLKSDCYKHFPECSRKEILSEFAGRLSKYWHKINPDRNSFSYITSMLDFAKRDFLRKEIKHNKRYLYKESYDEIDSVSEMQVQHFVAESKILRRSNNYEEVKRIGLSEIMTIEKMAHQIDNDLSDIILALTSEIRAMRKLFSEVSNARIGKTLKKKVAEAVQ